MNPNVRNVKALFADNTVYRLPRYQRTYEWTDWQWQGLARDITALTYPEPGVKPPNHFLGILLFAPSESGPVGPGETEFAYDIIDGQQRLVTLSVWLRALADYRVDLGLASTKPGFAEIEVGPLDAPGYSAVMDGSWALKLNARTPLLPHLRPLAAYHYFRWLLWLGREALELTDPLRPPSPQGMRTWTSADWHDLFQLHLDDAKRRDPEHIDRGTTQVDLDRLMDRTLRALEVLTLTWDERIDEPQAVIFEALNGARVELQQLDHVRNRIFLRLDKPVADQIYANSWAATEARLQRTSHPGLRSDVGSQFLYDFLISEGAEAVSRARAAAQLDQFSIKKGLFGTAGLITDVLVPAMGAWITVATAGSEVQFGSGLPRPLPQGAQERIASIRAFSISSDPLILKLLRLWGQNAISGDQLVESLIALDSFWGRHIIAGTNLSPYRSKFMNYMRTMGSGITPTLIYQTLEYPPSKDILNGIETRQLYDRLRPSQVLALLRGIERGFNPVGAHPMKGGKADDEFTVEHIAPRSLKQWAGDLKRWKATPESVEKVIHTLGNLTAATNKHNTQAGSRPLAEKQAKLVGEPPLRLNDSWESKKQWTAKEITARTNLLATKALTRWRDKP